ncbi:MAG: hypothetical protein ABW321_13425 [Polyangiales bacterium]
MSFTPRPVARLRVLFCLAKLCGWVLACASLGCGPSERSQLESALIGRGRIAVLAHPSWRELKPNGTELVALASLPQLTAAIEGADRDALVAAISASRVQGILLDVEQAAERRGLLHELADYARVPGLQGAYLDRHAALYMLDPVRVWSPQLRAGLAHVARRLVAGEAQPRMDSFPEVVRRLDSVEVMVLLRSGEHARLWRSARGSSFARALLTATSVARQRWIERSAALGGKLEQMLPTLQLELSLLQDDGEIGTRSEAFVDLVTKPEHGVGYERKGGWHYLLPDVTHKGGRKPSSAYRQLFKDDGLPVESMEHRDLRMYRLAVQLIGISEAPQPQGRAPAPPPDGLSDVQDPAEVLGR